jgi:Peptidase inhibitor I78 family
MQLRTVLLASVLAACSVTGACRDTSPTSPGSKDEDKSSRSREPSASGPNTPSRPPQPPSPPAPPAGQATCDHTKVQWAISEPASEGLLERARIAAGAGSARFLRPNQPITMEYLGSRLNLGLDERDIVRAAVCG